MFKYRTKLLVLILIPQRELVILEKKTSVYQNTWSTL